MVKGVLAAVVVALVGVGLGLWLGVSGHLVSGATATLVGLAALAVAAVLAWRASRRRASMVILVVLALVVGSAGWYLWSLNSKLGDIQRVDPSPLETGDRPPVEPTEALNLVLMGADNPTPAVDKPTVAELLSDGDWNPGAYRSDTLMVVHIPADRAGASVVSIPRDSYVELYDEEGRPQGKNKINAAFSLYGPLGTWRTVENLTGVRLDHMAIIDFEGFRDLTTAVGGVDVYVADSFYDPKQKQQWDRGWTHLEDDLALKYVRTRYGLAEGDFDRVERQQNFLRALLSKVVSPSNVANPVSFSNTVAAATTNLAVDGSWSDQDLRSLAFSLRDLTPQEVEFLTLPLDRYESVPGVGSVNIIDDGRATQLWRAFRQDDVAAYLRENPEDGLGGEREID